MQDRTRARSVILGLSVRIFSLVAFVVVLALAPRAEAGEPVVLESYTGERPNDVNRLLSPLLDELATKGFVAGADVVGRRFESRVSRPAFAATALASNFGPQAEKGHKAWIAGQFQEAVKILAPLVDLAHANPGLFAQNQPLREKLLKALIALALSQQRIGDPSATRQTFAEIVRSFPQATITPGSYGPDAANLFAQVKQSITAGGTGKLTIKVTNDGAAVFVNEEFQTVGSTTKDGLVPGEYRVFAQVGKQLSRSQRVVVRANDETTITINTAFDDVVHSSPAWTGLHFTSAADRERYESAFAAVFATGIDASGVVVVGVDNVKGRPALVGTLVNLINGQEIRRASVALDPDPPVDRLRSLARFLAGDDAAPGVDVLPPRATTVVSSAAAADTGTGVTPEMVDTRAQPSGGIWGGWKYLTGGLAVGGLAVGGYLLSIDEDCTDADCNFQRETTAPGWATLGAGVALTGVTLYLFLRSDGDEPTRSAFIVPTTGGGAYAGFATRF